MLVFYGMKMRDRHTGEIMRSRNPDFKERMHKTLLTSFHNHMRITRILCSLTETGFGMYAAELCKFLKREIYDSNVSMSGFRVLWTVYRDMEFTRIGSLFKSTLEAKALKTSISKKSTKRENSLNMSTCKRGKKTHKRNKNKWRLWLKNKNMKSQKMLRNNTRTWNRKRTVEVMRTQQEKQYNDCL
jgi:hypothetical protein